MEPTRPTVCAIMALRARGSFGALDRQRKPRTQITQSRRNRIWLLWASGVFAAGRGPVSRQRSISDGGAVGSGSFDQRGPVAARAVGEGNVLNQSPGHVEADDAGSAVGAFAQRRDRGAPCGPAGRRQGSGCSGTGAITRSPVAGGSNHRARLAPPGNVTESGSRLSVAFPRRTSGDSTRRASFAGPSCGLNPRTGSRGTFAGNGWRVPRVDVSGCATAGVAQRVVPASSHSRALGLDTVHLNGRSNSKMEPTRLTVRAIMALKRAAHFER